MSTDLSFGDLENSQSIQGTRLEDQINESSESSYLSPNDVEQGGSLLESGGKGEDHVVDSRIATEPKTMEKKEPELVTLEADGDQPEIKKRPSIKTINLPKDFGVQIANVSNTQKDIATGVESIHIRLEGVDNKIDSFSLDLRSLMEVYRNGMEQISKRIDRLGQNLRDVEKELVKSNSVRHETNLDILGIKVDTMSASLNDIEGAVNICKLSCEQTKDSLFALRTMDVRLATIEAKLGKDSRMHQAPLTLNTTHGSIEDIVPTAGPSKKRQTGECTNAGIKTNKRFRASMNTATDQATVNAISFPIGMHEYDQEKRFTYACRYAMVKGTKQGPKFERKCLFTTGHLSLMVSHRNFHANHGTFLLDGVTKEADHRLDGKMFVCIKTSMTGDECGWKHGALSQFNRHSRKFLHKEDIFLLNNVCVPCGVTFNSDAELLIHVNSTPACYYAKGQFGIDSKDYSATGLTCGVCGRSDFPDGNAVYQHQSTGTCKRGSEKVEEDSTI